jgi:hypothetical protein
VIVYRVVLTDNMKSHEVFKSLRNILDVHTLADFFPEDEESLRMLFDQDLVD